MKTLHPGIMYTPPCGGVQRGGFTPSMGSGGSGPPCGGLGDNPLDGGSGSKPPKEKFPCKCIL
jgi:hypothetical protein